MAIVHQGMTLEEFLALPERKPALEFEDGKVTRKVSPKGKHSGLETTMAECINLYARPDRLAMAFAELRSTFGGRSYVPDVSLYRWERIPVDERGKVADDFVVPPDVAIEIVSPRQSVTPLIRRCLWYVDNGVRAALLVDPPDESILLIRADHTTTALRGPDRIDLEDILPGFELTVQDLFDYLIIT
jgi:Uma2 family endonuclease